MFSGGRESVHWEKMSYSITAWCCFSIPPKNIRKSYGFLMFSGGIEKQHQAVMGLLNNSSASCSFQVILPCFSNLFYLLENIWDIKVGVYHIYNPFLANVPISYPLRKPENLWFSSFLRGYQMGILSKNKVKMDLMKAF